MVALPEPPACRTILTDLAVFLKAFGSVMPIVPFDVPPPELPPPAPGLTVALVVALLLPLLTSGVCAEVETSARLLSVPATVGLTVSLTVTEPPGATAPTGHRMLPGRGCVQPGDALTKVVVAGTE